MTLRDHPYYPLLPSILGFSCLTSFDPIDIKNSAKDPEMMVKANQADKEISAALNRVSRGEEGLERE